MTPLQILSVPCWITGVILLVCTFVTAIGFVQDLSITDTDKRHKEMNKAAGAFFVYMFGSALAFGFGVGLWQ